LTYEKITASTGSVAVDPRGNGLPVDQGLVMVGVNQWSTAWPATRMQPPPVQYALRMTSWELGAEVTLNDLQTILHAEENPENVAPSSWPKPHTQTILKAAQSPIRTIVYDDHGRPPEVIPAAPMWHISIFGGDNILVYDRGMYDYQAAIVRYERNLEVTAVSSWDLFRLSVLLISSRLFSVLEAPLPVDLVADYVFDELGKTISPTWQDPSTWNDPH
jgi:hypothetical protein